jgi:hypothetical protein
MQVGTDAPPEELQQQRMVLAQANELERKKVDQVFTERNGWDTKTKDIDHQVPQTPSMLTPNFSRTRSRALVAPIRL